MKAVSESLSVARSQLAARLKQPAPEPQSRYRRPLNDVALVEQIKQAVGALPSYGYRRVWGLLRRQHEQQALPPVNVKRVYRVMRDLRIPRSSGHPFHEHLTTDSTVIRPPIPRVSDH